MGYYPAFPPAIPARGVGCIRVTHPSATLNPPKGILPFDLHVLGLPLAFILSQDQTLHCIIVVLSFFPVFRVPLLLQVYLACFLCWLQTFKELRPCLPACLPRGAKTAAKLQLFPLQTTKIETFF